MPKPELAVSQAIEESKGDVAMIEQNSIPEFDVRKFYANIISYDED